MRKSQNPGRVARIKTEMLEKKNSNGAGSLRAAWPSLSWVFPVTMIVFIYSMLPSLRCSYRCICFSIVSILSRFLWLCEVCVVLKGCLMVAACGAILAQEPESIRVRQMFFSPIHRGEKKNDRFDYPGLSTLPRTLGGGFGKPARPPPNQGPGSNQWCASRQGVGSSSRDSHALGRPVWPAEAGGGHQTGWRRWLTTHPCHRKGKKQGENSAPEPESPVVTLAHLSPTHSVRWLTSTGNLSTSYPALCWSKALTKRESPSSGALMTIPQAIY